MTPEELLADADPLLQPLSADAPCGIDLSYAPEYADLATLMEGTPETQFAPGKDPDWRAVQRVAEDCLKRSKDLQIAVYFTVALSQTSGIAGVARGMELIAGLVRTYWNGVYPQLDPEDPDPTQRVNILSQLSVERGSFGDPVKFLDRLVGTTIFRVPGQVVTVGFLLDDAAVAAQLATITAAGEAAAVNTGIDALRRTVAAAHSVDDFLIQTLGRNAVLSFDALFKIVDKALRAFDSLKASTVTVPDADTDPTGAAPASASTARAIGGAPGEIRTHEDVRKSLQKIREFYAANEPASPVPYLLQRAEKLVGKNFLDLLKNLSSSGRSDFETLLGPEDES